MDIHKRIIEYKHFLFGGVIVALLLGSAAIFFVSGSLPGERLFGFKVNIWEEALELAHHSPDAKAEYHLAVLMRRLDEAKQLALAEPTEGDLFYFYEEVNERSKELIAHLAAEEGRSLSREAALKYNHRLTSILQAMEEKAQDGESLAAIEEALEDTSRQSGNIFEDRAAQFAVWGTDEEVRTFVSELLGDLLTHVEQREDMDRRTRDIVGKQIESAQEDLVSGRSAEAIQELAYALEQIEVADYLKTPGEVAG